MTFSIKVGTDFKRTGVASTCDNVDSLRSFVSGGVWELVLSVLGYLVVDDGGGVHIEPRSPTAKRKGDITL